MGDDGKTATNPRVGVYWPALAARPDQLKRLEEATGDAPVVWTPDAAPPEDIGKVDVLFGERLPDDVLDIVPHLKMVQSQAAGMDWLTTHPLWKSEVTLATAAGVHGVQIAEHTLMLLLALNRSLPDYISAQRRHRWLHDAVSDDSVDIAPRELYGLTLLLVGYGHIGRAIAHLAKAFGMRVLATMPSTKETGTLEIAGAAPFVEEPGVPTPTLKPDQTEPIGRLHALLGEADAVVICAPLTPDTENMIDAAALGAMKPDVLLVNIARGKIIDEDALIHAIRAGRLGGVGLDVTAEEPLPSDSPLWEMPNVIITPHMSGQTEHYVERAVNVFLANLDCLRHGKPVPTAVDRARGY